MVSFVFIANKIHRNFFYQIEVDLVKLYAPAVHRLKKNGISVYPEMKTVHTNLVTFRDMVYTRYIPKYCWYILFISFFGIWNIPGISQKNSGTYNFSVFMGYGIFKGYPQKLRYIA